MNSLIEAEKVLEIAKAQTEAIEKVLKGLDDIELAIVVAMLLAAVKQNKPDMPDQAFDKLLDIVKTGAKLRPEELATVLGTYRNSGVSGIGEIVKDIFSGMKGAN